MQQVVQNYRTGELMILEVPAPACGTGGVLVRNRYSLVSSGTESMKISESRLSLIGKARARPDQVKKVLHSASQQGLRATYSKVSARLDSYTPLGYSSCGEVVEVGAGVDDLVVGDLVACGGNQYAHHAEFNFVPRNLCVKVPPGASEEHAAFTTVGAVALQGYRQSEARLGEVAVVIGLGLVGQLLVQLLRAAGVRVLGIDPSEERCRIAERSGAVVCVPPSGGARNELMIRLLDLTGGVGADYIFLTAGGDTNEPAELAAELARDRARVVDIGKSRLDLPWQAYYDKELDVRFSRSYGPGRYDPTYEEVGVDYPIGYVRWTEQRNMACFLDLIAREKIDVGLLVSNVVPFESAVAAYERLTLGGSSDIGLLFRYRADAPLHRRLGIRPDHSSRQRFATAKKLVRLGVVGAGNYATSMLLPQLKKRDDVRLIEVATATPLSGANARRRFGFERCSTEYQNLLSDDSINAVLIATRHHAHARMVCEALKAGKAVFVEKPLAVAPDELAAVLKTVDETGNDRLMVGFNRRFAPMLIELRRAWGQLVGPIHIRYDVNAGRLDPASWYARPGEGPRLVGEGCHFIDTASWWLDAEPVEVFAAAVPGDRDDAILTLRYSDGSIVTLSYMTQGDARYPKESLQVFGGGQVARMQNFQRTEHWRDGRRHITRSRGGINKGQQQEMAAFVRAVASDDAMPISLSSLIATSRATFAAHRSVVTGRPELIEHIIGDGFQVAIGDTFA